MGKRWVRLAGLAAAVGCMLMVTACSGGILPQKQLAVEDLNFSFTCDAVITKGEATYTAEVNHDLSHAAYLTMVSPEEVAGMTYLWDGNTFRVTYEGLAAEVDSRALPQGNFATLLIDILNFASSAQNLTSDGNNQFSGTWSGIAFTFTADPATGKPLTLSVPSHELTATFTHPAPTMTTVSAAYTYSE